MAEALTDQPELVVTSEELVITSVEVPDNAAELTVETDVTDPEAAADIGQAAMAAAEIVRERSPATITKGGGVAIYGAFPGQRRYAGQGVNDFRTRRNFIG